MFQEHASVWGTVVSVSDGDSIRVRRIKRNATDRAMLPFDLYDSDETSAIDSQHRRDFISKYAINVQRRTGCAEIFQLFPGAAQAYAAAAWAQDERQEVGRNPPDQALRGRLP